MRALTLLICLSTGPALAQDDLLEAFRSNVAGLWVGDGGTCETQTGTWEFSTTRLRGNATLFDLQGVFGTTDRLVLQSLRQRDGAGVNLTVTPKGPEALAITGPGIAADVTRCTPSRPLDTIVAGMEAAAAAFDAATFKPVRLSGLTCGDNCYVDFTEQREGAADMQYLCLAPECGAWIDAGALPEGLTDVIVGAQYGTGQQVDGSGTVMSEDFPAIVAFGPPDTGPERMIVPLQPGLYVDPQVACDDAPNAAIREFTGAGFGGSATRDCEFYAPFRDGDTFRGMQTCTDTYSGQRSTVPLSVTLSGADGFTLTEGPDETQTFRFCQGD